MFNLSGSEVLFLLLAGLVVLGPERLPGVVRRAGRLYGDLRRAAGGVERELRETFGEPAAEMKDTMRSAATMFGVPDDEPSPPMRPERSAAPENSAEPDDGGSEDGGRG